MSQRRVGGNHFRTADDNPGVSLFFQLDVNVFYFIGRQMTIDRWVNNRVVKVEASFLNTGVPVTGVLLELTVKARIRAQCATESSFVVWGTAHPAIAQA